LLRWGMVVSVLYAAVFMGLLMPGLDPLAEFDPDFLSYYLQAIAEYPEMYTAPDLVMIWFSHVWPLMLISGQVLMLFLSVNTSWQRRKPRSHIALTITVTAMLVALLSFSAIWSLTVGFLGDEGLDHLLATLEAFRTGRYGEELFLTIGLITWWIGLWTIWAIAFYVYYRARSFQIEASNLFLSCYCFRNRDGNCDFAYLLHPACFIPL